MSANQQLMQPNFSDFDYVSDDTAVASVSDKGLVTAEGAGQCGITVTHKTIGRLTASARVVVS